METINRQSKTTVHFAVNYILAAPYTTDRSRSLAFQKALLDNGLEFSQTSMGVNSFTLTRVEPSQLKVKLESNGPAVSSIHIISSSPSCDLGTFIREAEAACVAYQAAFPAEQYQVVRAAAKIHHLYSCSSHAFKYIWEDRLGQNPGDFKTLGQRPVAGGGLRLIMPPHQQADKEPFSAEVRIESFMREPNKIFIETVFVWPKPVMISKDKGFTPADYLEPLEEYAANQVWEFLTQKKEKN